MNKTLTFVYGTLKKDGSNSYLLKAADFVGEAITLLDTYTMYDGGFPCVVKDGKFHIKGELYAVSDADLVRLDRLEGVPHHFMRHPTRVRTTDGEEYECFMYVGSHDTASYYKERNYPTITPDDNNVCEWLRQWPERMKKAS